MIGPPTSVSSATVPPIAIAAAAPTARVSVATAMITNISNADITPSSSRAVPMSTDGTVAPRFAGLSLHAASRSSAPVVAPATWAAM